MKNDLNDLKKLTMELMESGNHKKVQEEHEGLIQKIYGDEEDIESEEMEDEEMEVLQISQNQQENKKISIILQRKSKRKKGSPSRIRNLSL